MWHNIWIFLLILAIEIFSSMAVTSCSSNPDEDPLLTIEECEKVAPRIPLERTVRVYRTAQKSYDFKQLQKYV